LHHRSEGPAVRNNRSTSPAMASSLLRKHWEPSTWIHVSIPLPSGRKAFQTP